MQALKAKIQNGRYVIEEPANYPDGAEVQLQVVDADELDDAARAALHASIEEGLDDAAADRVISIEDSLKELRALRCESK